MDEPVRVAFAQKAVVVRDGAVLLVARVDRNGAFVVWELPGGRLATGETLGDGFRREVREEVGLDVTPGVPVHTWMWTGGDGNTIVAVAHVVTEFRGELTAAYRMPDEPLGEIRWAAAAELAALPIEAGHREAIAAALAITS